MKEQLLNDFEVEKAGFAARQQKAVDAAVQAKEALLSRQAQG